MPPFKPKIRITRWSRELEEEVYELWQKENLYEFNKNSGKPIFSIDTPPPYASGRWHIGGAVHYSQIDMIARTARMMGYEVLFPFGIDRNGLPVEVAVEKAYNIRMREIPREKFIELCKRHLDEVEKELIDLCRKLGLSCDLRNIYRTDSPEYRAVTQATFIELWKKGLIYEDYRPNNYCPVCQTTIADAEVEYVERETTLVYIKFKVKENGGDIVIATTRPELLCACAAVIFNPKDERYTYLEGKHAVVPIYGQVVPIIAHPYAKPEFGTGLVMVCSYGDYSDVLLFRELKLKPTIAIDVNGRMTKAAGRYEGLTIEEARREIVKDLEGMGLVVKKEKIKHRVPICWRSKNPIEFIPMKEYYLKQLPLLEELKRIVEQMRFHPPSSKKLLLDWINSVTIDWPISRRRYYGTEIPIWYCKSCGKPCLPEPGRYYQPWRENPPFDRCPHCGSNKGFVGEERTFDTWVDSSISALYILGYRRDPELFKKAFPCTLRAQARDIVRTWLYYTILRVYQLTGKPAFKHVWISGLGLDEKGEAMSKSKGNIVDPLPLIEKYGADAIRLWGASEASHGSDYRFSEQRVLGAAKFLVKLLNVARLISAFPVVGEEPELLPADKWILGLTYQLVEECMDGYKEFNFFIPATKVRSFVWRVFAPHYLEMVKARCYGGKGFTEKEQKAAWYTLHTVLKVVLRLLAPICPFITDYIWRAIYGGSVHKQLFPEKEESWKTDLVNLTEKLIEFNEEVWKKKKEMKLSLKDPIKIGIPEELKVFEKDLKAMHNIVDG